MKFAITFLFLLTSAFFFGQTTLKVNGITALVAIPQIGLETSIGKKTTFQVDALGSLWESIDGVPYKALLISTEFRYFFKEKFRGFYLGANLTGSTFKLQKYGYTKTNDYQKGYNYMVGITVGYQWKLNEKWGLDLFAGGGHQEAFYKLYDLTTNERIDTWYEDYNRSGEMIPYRGGLMITYKIK